MEKKPMDKLVNWYNENKEEVAYKGSRVEIVMYYFSMLTTLAFCVFTAVWCKFQFKFLLFLIPLVIWMFLRSSRKDMNATAYLVAGFFGAFGGALIVILERLLPK